MMPQVHNRFPTYDSLIEAKLLRKEEAERMRKVDDKTPHESTWQVSEQHRMCTFSRNLPLTKI